MEERKEEKEGGERDEEGDGERGRGGERKREKAQEGGCEGREGANLISKNT